MRNSKTQSTPNQSARYSRIFQNRAPLQAMDIRSRQIGKIAPELHENVALVEDQIEEIIAEARSAFGLADKKTEVLDFQRRAVILSHGESGLRKIAQEGSSATFSNEEAMGMEAIILADGSRPTISLDSGELDIKDARLGKWAEFTSFSKGVIEDVAGSIGRVDLNSSHRGTAFVIADGVIVTNRHVLQGIGNWDGNRWLLKGGVTLDFGRMAPESSIWPSEYKVEEVLHVGAPIHEQNEIDFASTDIAVLRCRIRKGDRFPSNLALESKFSDVIDGREIFTVGFPGKPAPGSESLEVLRSVFGYKFGIKRFAPGEISSELGHYAEDIEGKVFTHDASTLGGNSGSPVIDFGKGNGRTVVGLHFAGSRRRANFAHSVAVLRKELAGMGAEFV